MLLNLRLRRLVRRSSELHLARLLRAAQRFSMIFAVSLSLNLIADASTSTLLLIPDSSPGVLTFILRAYWTERLPMDYLPGLPKPCPFGTHIFRW